MKTYKQTNPWASHYLENKKYICGWIWFGHDQTNKIGGIITCEKCLEILQLRKQTKMNL